MSANYVPKKQNFHESFEMKKFRSIYTNFDEKFLKITKFCQTFMRFKIATFEHYVLCQCGGR